jgi:hypothetical protein
MFFKPVRLIKFKKINTSIGIGMEKIVNSETIGGTVNPYKWIGGQFIRIYQALSNFKVHHIISDLAILLCSTLFCIEFSPNV